MRRRSATWCVTDSAENHTVRKVELVRAAAVAILAIVAVSCCAQNFPTRPVRFVLSYGAPGGTPDIIARMLGARLTQRWARQVVMDPRPRAGGLLPSDTYAI